MTQILQTPDKIVIATTVVTAKSMWSRFMGLMGKKSLPTSYALILSPCKQIHMFFMRIPLDIAFVNNDGEIVHACHSIKPWRMSSYVLHAAAAIELPAGTLKSLGLTKGSLIKLYDKT